MSARRALVTFTLAAAVAAPSTHQAGAYELYRIEDGTPLAWPTHELRWRLAADLPDTLDEAAVVTRVERAARAWSELGCQPFEVHFEGVVEGLEGHGSDRVNAVAWVHSAAAWEARNFGAAEVARTVVTHVTATGRIVDVDTFYNVARFDLDDGDACAGDAYDLQAVATHEFGHYLGLDHTAVEAATMAPTSGPGECDKRSLHADDVDGFCAIYASPPEPAEPDLAEPTDVATPSDVVGGDTGASTDGAGADDAHSVRHGESRDCGAGGDAVSWVWALATWLGLCALRATRRRRRRRRPARAR